MCVLLANDLVQVAVAISSNSMSSNSERNENTYIWWNGLRKTRWKLSMSHQLQKTQLLSFCPSFSKTLLCWLYQGQITIYLLIILVKYTKTISRSGLFQILLGDSSLLLLSEMQTKRLTEHTKADQFCISILCHSRKNIGGILW